LCKLIIFDSRFFYRYATAFDRKEIAFRSVFYGTTSQPSLTALASANRSSHALFVSWRAPFL